MPGERGRCVRPGAVTDEDLVAYGRNEASASVAEHVVGCQVCRENGDVYARMERTMLAGLYRRTCPPSITIGEYAMGLLPSTEAQLLAEHVAECPHCEAERTQFTAFLTEADPPTA